MMVKKMQEAAAAKGIEAEIWAVGDADAVNNVEKNGRYASGTSGSFPGIQNEGNCRRETGCSHRHAGIRHHERSEGSGTGVKASWDVKSLTMALSLSVTGGSFYRTV